MMSDFEINETYHYQELKKAFDKYYQSTISPFLYQKEKIRLKYLNRFWFLVLLSVAILPVIALMIFLSNHLYHLEIDWALFYLPLTLTIYLIRAPYSSYRKQIKQDVMNLFVQFFEGFTYQYGKGMSLEEMKKSHIFPCFDMAQVDDCFYGKYEDVDMAVYEYTLKKRYRQPKGKTKEKIVFQGIAVELVMNKPFSGHTIALRDTGFFNVFKNYEGLERVKLEDVVFEKIFEVYATDQIEARYLLTTAFMERLLKLRSLYKGKTIQTSFLNNKILIAIDTRDNMFEPCSFFKTNLNKQKFDVVFNQFWTVFSIIHVLKLNQKLGF